MTKVLVIAEHANGKLNASTANEHALAATIAPHAAELAAAFSHVFGPSTTFGKDLMPRIAALLGAPQVSDIMSIESATRFRRPIFSRS